MPTSPSASVKPVEPSAVSNTAPSGSAGGLYLQVGAFQKSSDAENLKGRLAMMGFEASVMSVEIPDKGTLFRVRTGPYAQSDQMNQARIQLSQSGIQATVIRTKD